MLRATPMMLLLYAFLVNEFTDKASSRSISPCRAVNLKSEKPRKPKTMVAKRIVASAYRFF